MSDIIKRMFPSADIKFKNFRVQLQFCSAFQITLYSISKKYVKRVKVDLGKNKQTFRLPLNVEEEAMLMLSRTND